LGEGGLIVQRSAREKNLRAAKQRGAAKQRSETTKTQHGHEQGRRTPAHSDVETSKLPFREF
jgi:hypothetical protein